MPEIKEEDKMIVFSIGDSTKKEHYADGKEEWLPGHSLRPKKEVK